MTTSETNSMPCAARPPDVGGGREREHRQRQAAEDQVGELVVEVRQLQPDPVLPEALLDAHVPRERLLGQDGRIREAGEEQVVEGRRPEAAAGAAVQPRPPLLHHVGERAALGGRGAEGVVVLHPHAGRHEQPVEEAELLLEEAGPPSRCAARSALVPCTLACLLAPLDAEGRGAPLADVEVAQRLDLVAAHLEAAGEVAGRAERRRRAREGIGRIDEGLVVRSSATGAARPPTTSPAACARRRWPCTSRSPGACWDRSSGPIGVRVADELDRQAGVGLVVAHGRARSRVLPHGRSRPKRALAPRPGSSPSLMN